MKIRIKGNTIRYRLTRHEVEQFAQYGIVKEHTNFGGETLTYVLQRSNITELCATFKNNIITLAVPDRLADEWCNSEQVGIESKGDLYLLVEKDFVCIDNTDEDQSDNYPHPLTAHSHGK